VCGRADGEFHSTKDVVMGAIQVNKHVVTANKDPHSSIPELQSVLDEHPSVGFGYEACVVGFQLSHSLQTVLRQVTSPKVQYGVCGV
jgi:homoserine dehydrogenase